MSFLAVFLSARSVSVPLRTGNFQVLEPHPWRHPQRLSPGDPQGRVVLGLWPDLWPGPASRGKVP